jgi:hypothetical protein
MRFAEHCNTGISHADILTAQKGIDVADAVPGIDGTFSGKCDRYEEQKEQRSFHIIFSHR